MKCILCPNEMVYNEKEYEYHCPSDDPYFTHYALMSDQFSLIVDNYEINIYYDSKDAFIWSDGNKKAAIIPKDKIDWTSGAHNIKAKLDKLLILL